MGKFVACDACSRETWSRYLDSLPQESKAKLEIARKWMRGQCSVDEFDAMCESCTPEEARCVFSVCSEECGPVGSKDYEFLVHTRLIRVGNVHQGGNGLGLKIVYSNFEKFDKTLRQNARELCDQRKHKR